MTYRETVGKVAEELFYSLSKHISRSISRAAKWKQICPLHFAANMPPRQWNQECGINLLRHLWLLLFIRGCE